MRRNGRRPPAAIGAAAVSLLCLVLVPAWCVAGEGPGPAPAEATVAPNGPAPPSSGAIDGQVAMGETGPASLTARLEPAPEPARWGGRPDQGGEPPSATMATAVGVEGRFAFGAVVPGLYDVVVSSGSRPWRAVRNVRVEAGRVTRVVVGLDPAGANRLVERIAVAGTSAREQGAGLSRTVLGPESIANRPATLADPLRALAGMPGITPGNDFQSEVRIRGGEAGDTALLLDGLPLPHGYHFEGSGGSVSSIQGGLIGAVDVRTGGFSVEHGDALAGIIDVVSRQPAGDGLEGEAGLTTLQTWATLAAPFRGGTWMVSARAGDLGLYDTRTGEEGVDTVAFRDLLAGGRFDLGGSRLLEAQVLAGRNAYAQRLGAWGRAEAEAETSGGRLRLEVPLTGRRLLRVLAYSGHLRSTMGSTEGARADSLQSRIGLRLAFAGGSERHAVGLGAGVDSARGRSAGRVLDGSGALDRSLAFEDTILGMYAEDAWRPRPPALLTYGLRCDRASWTGETVLSPRASLELDLGPAWRVRGAAGRFAQFPRQEQVFLAGGDLRRQRADHFILGVERSLPGGRRLVAESYLKKLRDPIGEILNLHVDIPEISARFDAGASRGLELSLTDPGRGGWRWRAGYTLLSSWQSLDGRRSPRNADQRHAATFAAGRPLPRGWNLDFLLRIGSGLPYTPQSPVWSGVGTVLVPGPLNGARLPGYGRLDLRLARSWTTAFGRLDLHLDLLNLTNRENLRSIELEPDPAGGPSYFETRHTQAPFLPVLGLTAAF